MPRLVREAFRFFILKSGEKVSRTPTVRRILFLLHEEILQFSALHTDAWNTREFGCFKK
jgi:hypothetical protein